MAEQNNELLMKNHQSRPTGSAPLPEASVAIHDNLGRGRNRGRGRGRAPSRGRGRGRNNYRSQNGKNDGVRKERGGPSNPSSKGMENLCF